MFSIEEKDEFGWILKGNKENMVNEDRGENQVCSC